MKRDLHLQNKSFWFSCGGGEKPYTLGDSEIAFTWSFEKLDLSSAIHNKSLNINLIDDKVGTSSGTKELVRF